MIPVFDLDDTLYPERSFVESGFRAVAADLEQRFGWPQDESVSHMLATLDREGRGAVFDRLLEAHGEPGKGNVHRCIHVYRHHQPTIRLAPEARRVLDSLSNPYLVTDGHKVVQQNKVDALGIAPRFKRLYLTHRYGLAHAKPSTHCFELIRRDARCEWADMFYVGDNPAKDFVNLNPLGVHTIRVKTGGHAADIAKAGFEARHVITTLADLPALLRAIES